MMNSHSDSEHDGCGGNDFTTSLYINQHGATSSVTILGQGCTQLTRETHRPSPGTSMASARIRNDVQQQARHAPSGLQGATHPLLSLS